MKRTWKLAAKLTSLSLALSLLIALAACGGGGGAPTPTLTPEAAAAEHIFTGAYQSSQSDAHIDFHLELYSDGTLKAEPGVVFLDLEDYEESASGTWSDSNGTLKLSIENQDGTFKNEYEVPLVNGGFDFEMKVSLASFVRPITMSDGKATAPAPTVAPTESPDDGGEADYPPNTMVLAFTPDTSEQLKTTFTCGSDVWGPALGATGVYEPAESTDLLLSWTSTGSENYHLDFKADGTYEYQFTTVGVTETGTWTFTDWSLTVTTANGSSFTAEITK